MSELVEVHGTDLDDQEPAPSGHYAVSCCPNCPDVHLWVSARRPALLEPATGGQGQIIFLSKEEAKQLVIRLQKLIAEH